MSTTAPQGQNRPRHRMIDRMATILDAAARSSDGLTLSEFARVIGAPVSSTQGLVNGLVATGFLDERDRSYTLGGAPYLLNLIAGRRFVSQVTSEALDELRAATGLTATLAIAVGWNAFYVDHSSSDQRWAYVAENYVRRALIQSSSGLVLMAGMEKRDVWTYLRSLPESEAWRIERYFQLLPEIERDGVCVAPRVAPDGDAVSVAIRERGRIVGAVGLGGSVEEIAERTEELVALLTARAAEWAV